jgi:hypothetical protein
MLFHPGFPGASFYLEITFTWRPARVFEIAKDMISTAFSTIEPNMRAL